MIIKLFTAAFISFSFLVSCADIDDNAETENSLSGPATVNQIIKPIVADTAVKNTISIPPGITTGNTIISPAANNLNIIAPSITGKLNPAHGLPNHRCDIAVGAPLNSKPVEPNASPSAINTMPAPVNTNTQPVVQKVAPGMNPSHGQPGHRCDISVGAPLNSKPIQTASPAQTTVAPVNLSPVKPDSSKN